MEILNGLLTINGVDPYEEYGAFLAYREGEDPMANYSSLLTPPELKEQRKVELRERNGAKLPAKLIQRWKEREVTLTFAILADDKAQFEERYYGFLEFLRAGNDGWLEFHLTELSRTWRMYMRRVTPYEQLEGFEDKVSALFSVVFEEPSPNF
jgi:hypothetical protein